MTWRNSAASLLAKVGAVNTTALICGLFFTFAACGQQPKPNKQAISCATCHNGVTTSYATAPMRHAMEPHGASPLLAAHPDMTVQLGSYTYRLLTKNGQTTYTVSDDKDSLSLPVRWIFGQRSQTWVLEKDGHYYESLVSYFPLVNGLAITPGDQKITPHNLTEAMGRQLPIWETRTCFNCHGTGVIAGEKLAPEKVTPGVGCEHCHEGAEQHMTDAARDNFKTLPKSLKKLDAEQISDFCGQCHRTWDAVMRNKWHGPAFVRFQPYRLENSRCFIGNDARISCLACHNPHQPVKHDTAYYDAKCLACHAGAKSDQTNGTAKTCPVAKSNCTSCHMPKVELSGHARFTDHYIRVVRAGEPYPD
jgi:hypothetical protein